MDKGNTNISSSPLSIQEAAALLNALAEEYNTTIPVILKQLDSVSGDLNALHNLRSGDIRVAWNDDEDDMIAKNP